MIHIRELYRLQNLKRLRLIAGEAGLERTVTAAVLFEYDPSRMLLPDFYRGDLVVTTLAYARGEEQLVAPSLLALLDQGIAGLLVKTAYFSQLPRQVVDAANRMGTPLFLFDETYIEEAILELTDLIRGKRRFVGYEKEIDMLMAATTGEAQAREIAAHIDPVGAKAYQIYAFYAKETLSELDEKLGALLDADTQTAKRLICMEWRRMMLVIAHMDELEQADALESERMAEELLKRTGVNRDAFVVGVSSVSGDRGALATLLREAAYAARAASMEKRLLMRSDELGLYAYLFPMSENAFVCEQCRRCMARIREYDAQNRTNLAHTAQVYVEMQLEIAATAKALFQHPNTVRYRLGKIQRLMQVENDSMFAPMLSLTVSLAKILDES